ncbi:N-acetyl-gamma-glutamyl-phosphate reductase [Sphingomonas japonica]|uniref:N-acetyl-gamma-glutamyl-phosphate reductase n=1 Tax=Sphingomonas japonica TaxID=511662 RepID=A0ABX0U209_9SPHN|nr:N-acetyl-gamma-glutamyl-phosphate reductase [Sphingomonas japonica]NIJ24540.1 N-acetyl-gamma-glutamyl-phosphate reductase [Sphingomonas japonica]
MTLRVFIDGAAGTTGLEIHQRLASRREFALTILPERERKDVDARSAALNDADIVILCLPDDAARDAVAMIETAAVRVIDASSAHRVAAGWTYGFAELDPGHDAAIASASRVSNPGCYPTGFLALVRPLVRAGLVPSDWLLTVNATSGYSGGGNAMIAAFEDPSDPHADATAHRAYALDLAHKHLPELRAHAGLDHAPIFQPSVVRTRRGMLVEVPLHLHAMPGGPTLDAVRDALADAYRGSEVVRVRSDSPGAIRVEDDAGTDRMTLYACGNPESGQARLIATLDNLGKGASGAAVQNLNLMAGLEPTAGLTL